MNAFGLLYRIGSVEKDSGKDRNTQASDESSSSRKSISQSVSDVFLFVVRLFGSISGSSSSSSRSSRTASSRSSGSRHHRRRRSDGPTRRIGIVISAVSDAAASFASLASDAAVSSVSFVSSAVENIPPFSGGGGGSSEDQTPTSADENVALSPTESVPKDPGGEISSRTSFTSAPPTALFVNDADDNDNDLVSGDYMPTLAMKVSSWSEFLEPSPDEVGMLEEYDEEEGKLLSASAGSGFFSGVRKMIIRSKRL